MPPLSADNLQEGVLSGEPSEAQSSAAWHRLRCRELDAHLNALGVHSARVSNLRVILFIGFIAMLAWAEAVGTAGTAKLLGAAMLLGGFLAAVIYHQRVRSHATRYSAAKDSHAEAIARIHRDWEKVRASSPAIPEHHAFADDIDLVGEASLFSLLAAVRTPIGRDRLCDWLLHDDVHIEQVSRRHDAVRELRDKRSFREKIEVAGRIGVRPSARSLDPVLEWLKHADWAPQHRVLIWFARVSSVATVLLIVAHLSGVIGYALWLIPATINLLLSRRNAPALWKHFAAVEGASGSLGACERIVRIMENERLTASRLVDLKKQLIVSGRPVSHAIRTLDRLAAWSNTRRSRIAPVFQALFMWEVHLMVALERWRTRWGQQAPQWFDVVAEVEVLNAFGGLADDNPSWCYPTFVDQSVGMVTAAQIGHPLLPEGERVCNDVEIGPRGTFLFITGSNMSGKSTLLRSVGLNVVLAQAGAPVCAKSLRLSPVRLYTTMRVQDSLAAGESYFLAALKRLKQVVDGARESSRTSGPPLLYLLDEILQGTNSAERKIAVAGILRELLRLNAIGAVTSHDLTLADAPDLQRASRPVHFTEQVEGEGQSMSMTFDYFLRPGIAPTTNALRLMQLVGLQPPSHS